MASPSRRWIWAALFFFTYLAVHVAVPLKRYFRDDAIDLGWTMYSGVPERPDVRVQLRNGTAVPLRQFAESRGAGRVVGGKVDVARWVPPAVCPEGDVAGIELVYERSGRTETIPCP